MDFSLTEEQEATQGLARSILEDIVTQEHLKEVESREVRFSTETWKALAKANLLGLAFPEEYGGSDLDFLSLCLLLQEVGRQVAPVPALSTLVSAALPICKFGSSRQKEEILPQVASGRMILSFSFVDALRGEFSETTVKGREEGSGWILDGTRTCVPYAAQAGKILLPVQTGNGIEILMTSPSSAGVELIPLRSTSGEPWYEMNLNGVQVNQEDRLGKAGQGGEILSWAANRTMVGICGMQLGVAEKALEITARYTSERVQFDRPIATFQAVGQRAADAFIQNEAMRLTFWQAAWRISQSMPHEEEVRIAKYWAAEAGAFTTYAAQHLHGGIGVDAEYPLHRYYLLNRHLELSLGSASEQLVRLGASLAAG